LLPGDQQEQRFRESSTQIKPTISVQIKLIYWSNSKFYKFPKYNNIWSNSKILQSEKFPENHILSGQLSKLLL
jgi:hypothetical protein